MAKGYEQLRELVGGVESEADVYRRRKKRRGPFEGLMERLRELKEGPRPMPKWRPQRKGEPSNA